MRVLRPRATRRLLSEVAGRSQLTLPLLGLSARSGYGEVVSRRHDVCIEGFPRSGNTFSVAIFGALNPGMRIAHHTHVPAQVRRAVALGLPCLVLIRQPIEAAAAYHISSGIPPERALRRYVRYYKEIDRVRSRCAVCTFEALIQDPTVVARSLNATFNRDYYAEPLADGVASNVVEQLRVSARQAGYEEEHSPAPSAAKERMKRVARETLLSVPCLEEAQSIYRAWRAAEP